LARKPIRHTLRAFVRKAPRDVVLGVRIGHDVHGFGLLLERLDDAFEKTLPVFQERP
jgi:hypothetical protein